MKVLHLYAGNLFGGVETFLIALAQQRHLCPEMEPHFGLCFEGRLSETLAAANVSVFLLGDVKVSRPWTVLRARRRLQALLKKETYNLAICHSCWPMAVFGSVVKRQGLPLVFFAHDVIKGQHWLDRWAQRVVPDLAIANSQFTLRFLTQFYPKTQGTYLHLPVVQPEMNNYSEIRQTVRSQFGVSPETVVIVQVSRMERWKGHAQLLSALTQLQDLNNWVCWIAGGAQRPQEHEYLKELQTQAQSSGLTDRVRFLGQRADVPALLAAADIHCQPNISPEPFGISFIEALYASLPVVTTAMGGAQEIVDASCGRLVATGDEVGLAAALKELVTNPLERSRLSLGGPIRANQLCNPTRQLQELHRVFTKVIQNSY